MTRWRSSLLLPDTRSASPWIEGLTFGNSSRISLLSFLASSSDRPRRSPISWRTLFPPDGSIFPQSKILSERFRLTAFDSIRSRTDLRPELVVGQQGQRIPGLGQLDGCALEVEALSHLPPDLVERVAQLLLVEVAHHVERDVASHCTSCRSLIAADCLRRSADTADGPPPKSGTVPVSNVGGEKPGLSDVAPIRPSDERGVPCGQDGRPTDPVPFDRELQLRSRPPSRPASMPGSHSCRRGRARTGRGRARHPPRTGSSAGRRHRSRVRADRTPASRLPTQTRPADPDRTLDLSSAQCLQ